MKKNIIIGLLVAALILSGSYIAVLLNHNNQENEIKESEKQEQIIDNQKETNEDNKKEAKDTEEVQHNEETKEATKSYKYTCDKCGKGTDKTYPIDDMLLCKSCADATPVYLTDSECEGLYGSSYMCHTCGRFFSSSSNRDLCNHGVCKACQRYGKIELDSSDNEVIFIDGIGDMCLVHATQAEKSEGQY